MASHGFFSDHVNLIANNLRDRYKNGFPILKELIQNADDAKARRLVFGLHPGFKGQASHLLLQGPGLWVFNDGEFKPEDEKAIRYFGLNSKAGDSGSIGKFGLGMKSVFHLCEAFFYVAFDGQKNFDVFLNPWFDPSENDQFHSSWAEVAADEYDAIRSVVTAAQLNTACTTWFLLWIPLRQVAHVPHQDGKSIGAIVDKYPGDPASADLSFLADPHLGRKVRAVVPLLRNLETIELVANRQQGVPEFNGFKIQIEVDKGSSRVDHSSSDLLSAGAVTGGVPSKGKLQFLIQQKTLAGTAPFSEFKQLNAWPKTGSLNKQGKREAVPDKSNAEGAVMVAGAAADGERAKLDIHWAVFLPTEEGLSYEFTLDKSLQSYRIVLHGQFFVDAGRRGIAGSAHLGEAVIAPVPDLDDTDLHMGWNQSVAQRIVLPMFLPTVAQYAAKHLNPAETEELARAILLARSANTNTGGSGKVFWETFKNQICDGQAWVRLVTPEGPKWSLEWVNTDTRILKLPPPPKDDAGRPWLVLPGLKRLMAQGYLLLDETAPSLLRTYSNWENEILLELLQNINQRAACTETGMAYLASFLKLEQKRYVDTGVVQRALIAVLQNMLRTETLQTLRRVRSVFQDLVELVKAEFRFAIGPAKAQSDDDEVLKLLFNVNTDKLLLPRDLDPSADSSTGVPTEDEIRAMLSAIHDGVDQCYTSEFADSDRKIDALLRASTAILRLLPDKGKGGDERGFTIRVNKSFRVLSAICARTGKYRAVSFTDLILGHQNGLVFKQDAGPGAGGVIYPVAKELAKLIPSEQIWVISAEISKWLQSEGGQIATTVPSAGEANAAYVALGKLNHPPTLTSVRDGRLAFIQKVVPTTIKGDDMIRGYRYVLHGSAERHAEINETLWINAVTQNKVWVKLKRMVDPDPWNVVDPRLAAALHLRADDKERCHIFNMEPDEVLNHLKKKKTIDEIDATLFEESERMSILARISDEDLWRSIPLHRDSKGGFGAITQNCYIDPQQLFVPTLADSCRIFSLSDNNELSARQKKLIPCWTYITTIERALAQANPADHWSLILDAIGQVEASELGKIAALNSKSWLPLRQLGRTISPADVIDLEYLADEIDRLAAENDYCYVGIAALSTAVTAHKHYKKLCPLFAHNTDALQRLGQLMAESDRYWVGAALPESEKLKDYLDVLANISCLPGWGIVKLACTSIPDKETDLVVADVQQHLLPELCKPLKASRLVQVLCEIPNLGKSKKLSAIFNGYLKQLAADATEAKSVIKSLRLLACDESWQKADRLCVGVEGVDHARLLDAEQTRILNDIVCQGRLDNAVDVDDSPVRDSTRNNVQVLENYFKPWQDSMPQAPIGGLFALLGLAFRNLASDWLKPHSLEVLIESIRWQEPSDRNSSVWDYRKTGGYKKLEALEMLDFIPVISDVNEIAVQSLLGSPMKVPRSSRYDNLVVGNITWVGTRTGRNAFKLPLRMVSLNELEQLDKAYLSTLIRNTCACILKEAYNQRSPNLEAWDSLEKSDQLELEVARELILESLPSDLRNSIAKKQNQKLKNALNEIKKLEKDRADKNLKGQSIVEVDRNIISAKHALAHLMDSDRSVQAAVLNGIRDKVKKNQYSVSSVAFELLQNADDAVVELKTLIHSGAAQNYSQHAMGRFVVESKDQKTVRFLHWGRPINFMGNGTGRNESHGEDLQRMLVLAASDKEDASGVTGKFGLGFKSVLLATDMPCLVSGDLKAKIVGGCLPEPWLDAAGAREALQEHRLPNATSPRGTVIEFCVKDDVQTESVLNRFAALAGLQCVFSKEIRSINVDGQQHCWSPERLVGVTGTEVGSVQLPLKSGNTTVRLLNLRFDRGCLAFRLNSRGCAVFNVGGELAPPGVWVTAPTGEAAANGVILNGPFVLDTGRGGLPHGEGATANLQLAEEIGQKVAVQVCQLISARQQAWPAARDCLGLNKDVTAPEFWASFLDRILEAKDREDGTESERLLARMGCSFYEKFLANTDEIPNGLPGEMSDFVRLTFINLSLNEHWTKHFANLKKFATLVNMPPVKGWVSEAVAHRLKISHSFKERSIDDLSVDFLLKRVPQSRCNPAMAASLSELLANLKHEEQANLKHEEQANYASKLKSFYFHTEDGSWKLGIQLLKSGCPKDEPYIAFAPLSALLNKAYVSAGLELVKQFSPCEPFHPGVVAQWILAARADDARVGALRCLLSDSTVRTYVGCNITGTWVENLTPRSQYLAGFSVQQKNQLLVMFKTELVESEETEDIYAPEPELLQGHEALWAIHEWWHSEGEQHLKWFDREFWPNEVPRNFTDESDSRGAWMTLFAIGLMQGFGRVKNNGNRGYIDYMQSNGWWDVFCNVDPHEDGQAWLNILNEYGELQVEKEDFGRWMEIFPRLYRVARWFNEYKHQFESIDQRTRAETNTLLSIGADSTLSGSGIYAPTLMRGLKLGKNVVIRELLRCGVLKSETAKSLAFKPGSSVQKLFSNIGFDYLSGDSVTSQNIYDVLYECLEDGAEFNGAYDIPLQIIALNTGLQQKILGGVAVESDEYDEY